MFPNGAQGEVLGSHQSWRLSGLLKRARKATATCLPVLWLMWLLSPGSVDFFILPGWEI